MGKRFRKRVCAVFVSAILAAGQLPLVTLAENILQEEGMIVSFEPLDSEVAVQTVMMGTELSELDLPDKLKAVIYPSAKDGRNLAEDILEEDETEEKKPDDELQTATPGNAYKSMDSSYRPMSKAANGKQDDDSTYVDKIPVIWKSTPVYDGKTQGEYIFTAEIRGYIISPEIEAPKITVTVAEASPAPLMNNRALYKTGTEREISIQNFIGEIELGTIIPGDVITVVGEPDAGIDYYDWTSYDFSDITLIFKIKSNMTAPLNLHMNSVKTLILNADTAFKEVIIQLEENAVVYNLELVNGQIHLTNMNIVKNFKMTGGELEASGGILSITNEFDYQGGGISDLIFHLSDAKFYNNSKQDVSLKIKGFGNINVPSGSTVEQFDEISDGYSIVGNYEIPKNQIFLITEGMKIFISDGAAIINYGTIVNNGSLRGSGTIINYGTINDPNGKIQVSITEKSGITEPPDITGKPATGNNSHSGGGGSNLTSSNTRVLRGTWERRDTGIWMLRLADGTYANSRWGIVDSFWYYFNQEGQMLTGWQFLGGKWYYLSTQEYAKTKTGGKEGSMQTGWYLDPIFGKWFYLDADGSMVTGWKQIDGAWYYFNPVSDGTKGVMVTDSDIDGYHVGSDGKMQ